jgi:hypothetical protein
MSGHGKREATLMAIAAHWRDRVRADVASAIEAGPKDQLSIETINGVIDAIAGHIAAGETFVVVHRDPRWARVVKLLAAYGHVEMKGRLVRPLGVREDDLFDRGR